MISCGGRSDKGHAARDPRIPVSPTTTAHEHDKARANTERGTRIPGSLLLGGDKQNNWTGWYTTNVPAADNLYDAYLNETKGR